ncbi:unnamed protein product [Closterium sp. NIES-54]
MAAPCVLHFDAEGRALESPSWLIRVERSLKSQLQDNVTLWAHASGDLPEHSPSPALGVEPDEAAQARFDKARIAYSAWQSHGAAACIALSSLLPETEEAHFSRVRFAKDMLAAIKTCYSTPTSASLGRLFLPFLFPDLAAFDRAADLITHLRSLDVSYRAACTEAQLALLPPPMAITIHFIATSLLDRLAPVCDELLRKHLSELTIDVLETALKDIGSNIRFVASGTVVPPLFQGCTVPQLPTFTASLASTASPSPVETGAVSTVGGRSRGKGGKRGGKGGGAGGGGGGGGGSCDTSASSGGNIGSGSGPAGLTGGGAGVAAWYMAQRQQQPQPRQPQQQVQWQVQQQPQQWGLGGPGSAGRGGSLPSSASRGVIPPPCLYVVQSGGRVGF